MEGVSLFSCAVCLAVRLYVVKVCLLSEEGGRCHCEKAVVQIR